MNKRKDNILIVGSGAIGLLWYSHFHIHIQNNDSVNCFLYQSPTRKPLQNEIKFTSLSNKEYIIPNRIITSDKEHPIDIILICVKSYQLNQAITDIKDFISDDTLVIITHNGLGAMNEQSVQLLQHNVVLDLLTTHGSLKVEGNEIIHTGSGISQLGLKSNFTKKHSEHNIQKKLIPLLNETLPDVIWCDDILLKQWVKLTINCVINPLTALFDIKNGDISNENFTKTIEQIIDEVTSVAHVMDISLHKEELLQTVLLVAKNTSNNSSSMRCDVQEGRETEVEYINGYIHRLGQELNIPTPKNTELYQKILAL